jgi:hypothetical protein
MSTGLSTCTTYTGDRLPFPARASDPDTSHQAAALDRVTLRARVHSVLERCPEGLTDFEITAMLGMDLADKPTCGKRREECGAIDTGRRRPSPKGNPCVVWALDQVPES